MKLGEALTVRRRQAEKLNDLRNRIKVNVLVQEGDQAQENVDALVDEYEVLSEEHGQLVRRINRTNLLTSAGEGVLLDLLSEREHRNRIRNTLLAAVENAQPSTRDYRFMRTEIKFTATIDVARYRGMIDSEQEAVNRLDLQIQEINWATDLIG